MEGVTYKFRNHGALLFLPNGAHGKDVIRTGVFEKYIRDHVDRWFNWAQNNKLGVEHMEDLILVSGCTMTTSWAAAAFGDNSFEAEISLSSRIHDVAASFAWGNTRGPVVFHNSQFDPVRFQDYCFARLALILLCYFMTRITHARWQINASLSGASEQSASPPGADESLVLQNPALTTLITAGKMRYKYHYFQVLRK